MRKALLTGMFTLLVVAGCLDRNEKTEENEPADQAVIKNQQVNTLAEQLEEPWEIVEAGESIYISERSGAIVEVTDKKQHRKPVELDAPLADEPESGLLGLAFPKNFEEEGRAYTYYSYQTEQGVFQRISEIKEMDDHWLETKTIVDKIPGGRVHHGGRLEIGPDDKLYATVGDATNESAAQDRNSLSGSILRINQDGSIPEDNPFSGSFIYSWGHRNHQGLAWDEQGNLYATEHGSQAHDEINLIESGSNYGWPEIEGGEQAENMESPILHSSDDTWAPSGMDFYQGNFIFASLRGESVRSFNPDNKNQQVLVEGYGRIRDVLAGGDGIYFITNNTDGRGNPGKQDDRLLYISLENESVTAN
ncbi:PQQ-dependent sugar dehydrogenase [Sediminibacillus albus]|uniref:Glucose/arabinose dehydrogenase, beta-propeller fold n=1 Tax=Sediminibacillus albus TaxID=407036 RepID=A0A1G9AT27_9BACI|nr:PQQ-dependent sugar dehydrogenase [Sediminibacillus albus]SDK30373.1 Glucose/arabinose dehydrogenase, beta-propeller fold [Sediminibacillus albus]